MNSANSGVHISSASVRINELRAVEITDKSMQPVQRSLTLWRTYRGYTSWGGR